MAARGRRGVAAKLILISLVAFTVFLLGALIWTPQRSMWKLLQPGFLPPSGGVQSDGGSGSPGLGIVLHPELHVSRGPKTIFMQWDVTEEILQPDGVKKNVYLVNGKSLNE